MANIIEFGRIFAEFAKNIYAKFDDVYDKIIDVISRITNFADSKPNGEVPTDPTRGKELPMTTKVETAIDIPESSSSGTAVSLAFVYE